MIRVLFSIALLALAGCKPEPAASAIASPSEAPAAAAPAEEVKSERKEEAPLPDAVRWVREAEAAFQSNRLELAIEKAKAALESAPQHAVAHNILGRALAARFETSRDEADAEQARRAFQAAAQANPGFWPALQNLGELYEKQGRPVEASVAFKQVLALEPNHPEKARYEALVAQAGRRR